MDFMIYGKLPRENMILFGNAADKRKRAETIVFEAKQQHPEWFTGNQDSFFFELRYAAPFDKGFSELRRLQGVAANMAGRRDNFRGYIIIDLSNYLGHEEEPYFQITLQFLADMSDYWKYIFLVDNKNQRASRELVGKALRTLFRDIPCGVEEDQEKVSAQSALTNILNQQKAVCDPFSQELLLGLMNDEAFGGEIVSALVRDITGYCGNVIIASKLLRLLESGRTVVKYMLTDKEYGRLMDIAEKQKEARYGEKKAI